MEKIKLAQKFKEEIVKQYPEAATRIAQDFVGEYVDVDMYRVQDEFGCFSKYYTVGVTADERFDSEFNIFVDGRLEPEKEQVMISDMALIIAELYSGEIACKSSTVVKVSDKAKGTFGFDYYLFDFHDLGVTCEGEAIYHIQLVQIYENEYHFIQQNDHNDFLDLYEENVPEDEQFCFGTPRKPLDI